MFEGFETLTLAGEGADIFCRIGGSGPPLLLLHGYPETSAMWAGIAPSLAERFTVVAPDLRGYGRSSVPASQGGEGYSKRLMGGDMARLMSGLGFDSFRLAGHDRGGRVAYRMALDMPERVERLAVLDIVPTAELWEAMDAAAAMKVYHWLFLAQPYPLPETLIASDPVFYLDRTIASWTGTRDLAAFDAAALDEYRRSFAEPERIHAACEDYRAGHAIDWPLDRQDRQAGKRFAAPTLALWGQAGIPGEGEADPLTIWRRWCDDVEGRAIEAGHFIAEEAPEETLRALTEFFGR